MEGFRLHPVFKKAFSSSLLLLCLWPCKELQQNELKMPLVTLRLTSFRESFPWQRLHGMPALFFAFKLGGFFSIHTFPRHLPLSLYSAPSPQTSRQGAQEGLKP